MNNQKEYVMKIDEQELKFSVEQWRSIYNLLQNEIPDIEIDFYSDIVKKLKNEAKELNRKLNINSKNEDFNKYITILKSLRETLDLISKYDWRLMYSEYKIKDNNDNWINQVSIWEQNHDTQIKNHKYWNIIGERVDVTNI